MREELKEKCRILFYAKAYKHQANMVLKGISPEFVDSILEEVMEEYKDKDEKLYNELKSLYERTYGFQDDNKDTIIYGCTPKQLRIPILYAGLEIKYQTEEEREEFMKKIFKEGA